MRLPIVLIAAAVLLGGCSKPLLVVDPAQRAADVEFVNTSSGYLQQFYFDDPVTCKVPYLIAHSVQPYESKRHRLPGERLVTIWTSAWGLPAQPGEVAWCRPHAFSTRLASGTNYRISFEVDPVNKRCGTRITSTAGTPVKVVHRQVEGSEIGGGGPAGQFSCKPDAALAELE